MSKSKIITVDHIPVPIEEERNLLEVIRKANIELPTFCYHSEMSIYGACRLCLVEIEGRGLQPACSTLPEAGLIVHTNTQQVRALRRMILELMLASHERDCPTCVKSGNCQLQKLAWRMGVTKVRFSHIKEKIEIDESSFSIVRNPNKCILCGDCVRMCNEIQGVGAIDFAYRGAQTAVLPSFGKNLDQVECVSCGQCARVCPTGALYIQPHVEQVWDALHDENKKVVAQIAPAVRVALGESFNLEPGTISTGRIIAALRRMGFAKVYDTSFAADLAAIEEGEEFLKRLEKNENYPHFTSCCPGWVKYAEQYYPEFLPHLSTCSSPQQMMGTIIKKRFAENNKNDGKEIVVVAIMPCTAKKSEAFRPEFARDSVRDVDYVLTTRELALMIKEMGINFNRLEQESFDLPFGFNTGGGVIFGNSGGVTEAVLRYVAEKISGTKSDSYVFNQVRGRDGIREIKLSLGEKKLSLAVVSGLGNAQRVMKKIKSGEVHYDFVEIMACPGGCVNGGGQPISKNTGVKDKRAGGLYDNDKMLQLHKPQENPYVSELYELLLNEPGSKVAHHLLHTAYQPKKRIAFNTFNIGEKETQKNNLEISICFGTSCLLKGSQRIYSGINQYMKENNFKQCAQINATFCFERCGKGPVVKVGDQVIEKCTLEKALQAIHDCLEQEKG